MRLGGEDLHDFANQPVWIMKEEGRERTSALSLSLSAPGFFSSRARKCSTYLDLAASDETPFCLFQASLCERNQVSVSDFATATKRHRAPEREKRDEGESEPANAPLVFAGEIEHAGLGGVIVTDGGLLVESVELRKAITNGISARQGRV